MRVDGLLLVDKPRGLSSAAVVEKVKRFYKAAKAGHGGTLDPMATGLLPVAVGEATKLLWLLLDGDKEYLAEALLGVRTDTDDAEGAEVERVALPPTLEEEAITAALLSQVGPRMQRPPVYSALKRDGKPLYARARAGEEVEVEPRRVEIYEIERQEAALPRVRFRVACGKGTYIRSIARDLGEALGVGAHLAALRRTKTLGFSVERATPLDQLGEATLISCEELTASLPSGQARAEQVKAVQSGKVLRADEFGLALAPEELARILDPGGALLALARGDQDGKLVWQRIFVGLGGRQA